jgi:LacI family transcriptional regulator
LAAYQLVKSYLERGLTKIVFIDGEYNRFIVEEMLFGIKRAFNECQIDFNGYVQVSESYQESYQQLKGFLKHNKIDLCIGARDSLAIAALNAALDLGIKVPDELEIIGFNNTKYARMARPSLSTIHVPLYEMGSIAAQMITKMLNNDDLKSSNMVLETEFIKRDTTK